MKYIFLCDESTSVQKVVTMLFMKYPEYTLKIYSNKQEVSQAFSEIPVADLIISSTKFDGITGTNWFDEIKNNTKELLLLCSSDENISTYLDKGFKFCLKKPFHSQLLLDNVFSIIGVASDGVTALKQNAPEKFSASPDFSPAKAEKEPEKSPTNNSIFQTIENNLPTFSPESASTIPFSSEKSIPMAVDLEDASDIPNITMSVDKLAKHYSRITANKNTEENSPFEKNQEIQLAEEKPMEFGFSKEPSFSPQSVEDENKTENSMSIPSIKSEFKREIELDLQSPPPALELEDVIFRPGAKNSANKVEHSVVVKENNVLPESMPPAWRQEIIGELDSALMRALERAVPAKIQEKLDLVWPEFVEKVADKVKQENVNNNSGILGQDIQKLIQEEISRVKNETLKTIAAASREAIKEEIGKWFTSNGSSLAKDVIKDEIRVLLAEI